MLKVVATAVTPEGVTEVGLRLHVTPLATEENVSATPLLNPLIGEIFTVEVAEPPGATVNGDGVSAEI